MTEASASASSVPSPKTFADFLQSTPPEVTESISDLATGSGAIVLKTPDILIPCDSEECNGKRFFESTLEDEIYLGGGNWRNCFIEYRCKNCEQKRKIFALAVRRGDGLEGFAYKFGEFPIFGDKVPARLITLMGSNRELFLQGLRAERKGLGIGAFAYYRRVVEDQKGRIIREIGRVAKKLGAKKDILDRIEKAASETQFKKIEDMKDAIPDVLRIEQQNPLTLLHTALSEGLHSQDDKVCLELAHSIRMVLTELAERMAQVLKEKTELTQAVSKLLNRPQTPLDSEEEH